MTTPDSKLRDYGVGVTAVALAFVIRWLLTPVLGSDLPYPTFFLAVMLTAWVGGLRPALLALVLSLPLAGYFFVAPRYSLVLAGAREAIGFGIFTFVSLLMSIMSDSLRKAWQEASTTNLDLLAQQKRLELEMGERERAQLEAHTQREWFRVTFSSIGDGVIACDTNSRVTYLNGVAQALTGWSQDEAAGRLIHEVFRIVNEHSHAPVEDPVAKVLREGRIVGLANHTILIDRLGVERAIDDSAAPIKDETGNILGVVLIFRDVSERRQSSLYRSRLVALVRSSEDAIIGYDLSGVITSWNAGAERMYGFRAEEVLGKRLIETIVPPDGVEAFVEILQRIKRGERLNHFEAERLRHDGQHVDVSISVSPVEMQGEVVGVAAIDRDVTARKATERRRNARLAITQILATEKDIGEAGRRILEAVCRGLLWDLSCLWLV
ncbi:MAG: PAS domain S-box protein, partial [Gemmataceae bacterium]